MVTVVDTQEQLQVVDSKRLQDAQRKSELLEKYEHREPTLFRQFDGFHMPDGGDCAMTPDEDGVCLMGGNTYELMSGCSEVRVLIRDGVDPVLAATMLRKIAYWVLHPLPPCEEEMPF